MSTLTTQYVAERMGVDATDKEAEAMIEVLAEQGITDEAGIYNTDDDTWTALLLAALERTGNRLVTEEFDIGAKNK